MSSSCCGVSWSPTRTLAGVPPQTVGTYGTGVNLKLNPEEPRFFNKFYVFNKVAFKISKNIGFILNVSGYVCHIHVCLRLGLVEKNVGTDFRSYWYSGTPARRYIDSYTDKMFVLIKL